MKCQCGAGYCPEDNLTYPCVCELTKGFKLDPLDPEDVILDEEDDDLPF